MNEPWYKDIRVKIAVISGIFIITAAIISKVSCPNFPYKEVSQPNQNTNVQLSGNKTSKPGISIISIATYPVNSSDSLQMEIKTLRKQKNLRGLTALESGKELKNVPTNTYCFMHPIYLRFNPDQDYYKVFFEESRVDRFRTIESYFEIHRYGDDSFYLIVCVSSEAASNISQLDGKAIKELVAMPSPLQKTDHLALIPMNRIIESKYREISLDNGKSLSVLDIKLK